MENLNHNLWGDFLARKDEWKKDFKRGIRHGIPIALGYIPVSFTFGLTAVKGGIPLWITILISLTNLTSAGQFAGASLIIANASLLEITLTTFVINIRYMLMSLSLSQKITPLMPILKRCILAFGITDETFAVASLEKKEITFPYMLGLIACPYWGWALGTALGGIASSILPQALRNAMGIALYGMFIALIIPAAKKARAVSLVVLTAISVSSLFNWLTPLNRISGGWVIIIATVIAASVGALVSPREDEEDE
ncbi:MAG TPA: AzlC family ABC transporter permease [Clostridia bacterium]|nr:AzlC family ABC transporter permease [Clostridia bacterium]